MNHRQNRDMNYGLLGQISRLLIGSLLIGIVIVSTFECASGQVVIVPGRFRSERSANKSRSKAKKDPPISVEQASVTIVPEMNDTAARLHPNAFSISVPDLTGEPMSEDKNDEKTVARTDNLKVAEFNVITADTRGKVIETRTESIRLYTQELPGAIGLEMVELPGGTFLMGADSLELDSIQKEYLRGVDRQHTAGLSDRIAWETPQHQVSVSAVFMSRYEITQSQWRAVAGLPKVNIDLISDPSQFKGGSRPVEHVSWAEAMEFCARLTRLTGRTYRLPTEAEWEYACRAGTNTTFNSGGALNPDWANYNGRKPYGESSKGKFRGQTVTVGSLGSANAFGLFDMHGNVWEWTQESWSENPQAVAEEPDLKILRGGAWDSAAGECRSGARQIMPSILRSNNIGFRVVVE